MLVRFAYLAVTHAFTALRLLPMTDREKDVEILALRHQLTVLQRQLGDQRPRLRPEDKALLAALLLPMARATLRRSRLLVSPDTVLRWHRDLVKHRHARASGNRGPGRPRLRRSAASFCAWHVRTPASAVGSHTWSRIQGVRWGNMSRAGRGRVATPVRCSPGWFRRGRMRRFAVAA